MYPREFFDTYWRPEIRDEVFVAMPFNNEFMPVWEKAILPAIDHDVAGGLRAKRADATVLSGSIITDILERIAHSRLILADVSIAHEGKWQGQRNGNVMYEVGLAQAIRQSSEMLLIRSDDDPINFDVAHINIRKYNRNFLLEARSTICQFVKDLLQQIEQEKGLKVTLAIDMLDVSAIKYIAEFAIKGPFTGPTPKTMGEELIAISNRAALARLQQLGIVRCTTTGTVSEPIFLLTPFGRAVANRLGLP
jgi:hypothetical protein